MKVGRAISAVLREVIQEYPDVVLLGEDILDPYGGAFKITNGLSNEFPDRLFGTPISEAGIVGVASGLAIAGYKPIVEIMFGDFLGLAFDQILNHCTKYPLMFQTTKCPIVIRTPMGGRKGYGPTHSQTLEKHFLGIPGLSVLALSEFSDIRNIYKQALNSEGPSLIIENKLLYNREYMPIGEKRFIEKYQCYAEEVDGLIRMSFDDGNEPDVVIITYGGMAGIVIEATLHLLLEFEILAHVYLITDLRKPLKSAIFDICCSVDVLATIEEGTSTLSIGNHFVAQFVRDRKANFRYIEITAKELPIPSASKLEDNVLPNKDDIISKIVEAL